MVGQVVGVKSFDGAFNEIVDLKWCYSFGPNGLVHSLAVISKQSVTMLLVSYDYSLTIERHSFYQYQDISSFNVYNDQFQPMIIENTVSSLIPRTRYVVGLLTSDQTIDIVAQDHHGNVSSNASYTLDHVWGKILKTTVCLTPFVKAVLVLTSSGKLIALDLDQLQPLWYNQVDKNVDLGLLDSAHLSWSGQLSCWTVNHDWITFTLTTDISQ